VSDGDVNPLEVRCKYCDAWRDMHCRTATLRIRGPHAVRVRLATVLAAHADPALDEFFPRVGPCGICGTPGLDQRHRLVDGIAGMLAAGEDPHVTADEHGVTMEAVGAVAAWAGRWPGAWQ
jgi:hypothetical protein